MKKFIQNSHQVLQPFNQDKLASTDVIILLVYTDDLILAGIEIIEIMMVQSFFYDKFKIKDLEIKFFSRA